MDTATLTPPAPSQVEPQVPTPTPAPAPEAAPAAKREKTPEQQALVDKFFDRTFGVTAEQARTTPNSNPMALKSVPETPNAPETPPEAPAAPETKSETEPKKEPKRTKKERAELDPDALARAVGEGVAQGLERLEAKKPRKEPEPKIEIHPAIKRDYEALQALEELDPKRKGVAEKYAVEFGKQRANQEERTRKYIARWEDQNPDKTYNSNDVEHNEFFERIEAEPLPDIGVTDEDLEAAKEYRIEKRVMEKVARENQTLEQRVRQTEAKEEIAILKKDAEIGLLKELKVESLDKLDDMDRPIYKDAVKWSQGVAENAHKLFNGLEGFDENNVEHGRVLDLALMIEQELVAKAREEGPDSVVQDGRRFLPRQQFAKLAKNQQANYWTVGPQDVIERGQMYMAEQVQVAIKNRDAELENYAKKRGYKLDKTSTPAPAPVAKPSPAPVAQPRNLNAPSLSSDIRTPTPLPSASPNASKGLAAAISRM